MGFLEEIPSVGRYGYFLEPHIVQINLLVISVSILFDSVHFFSFFFAERLSFSSYCSQEGLCQGSQAFATEGSQAWYWSSCKPVNISEYSSQTNFVKLTFLQFILRQYTKFRWYIFSQNGFTPLHIAAKYGNQNVAGVLIQHGATIDYKTKVLYYIYSHIDNY